MSIDTLISIATAMMADGKGLLAADESTGTLARRFKQTGVAQSASPEASRAYREVLFTSPGLAEHISGVILFDETIRQRAADGTPFVDLLVRQGIVPGIKVDLGAKPLAGHAGETVTEGLDGLRERFAQYAALGAQFAKWRGVIAIGGPTGQLPSTACIDVNAHALARYAALCQEAGLVPIVEPEVLMDGDHTLERCRQVTHEVLLRVFEQLARQGVRLEGMVLKPNMVVPGLACPNQAGDDEIADATVTTLRRCVPAAVAGIAFLSGGQSGPQATARLNAMQLRSRRTSASGEASSTLPWPLTYSYGRALQDPALSIWGGDAANTEAAQQALLQRARCNGAARRGLYTAAMEDAAAG